jgi:hypothetical protein
MQIKEVTKRPGMVAHKKLNSAFIQFEELLKELRKKEIPEDLVSSINDGVESINSIAGTDKELRKHLKKMQGSVLKLIEKELKLVTINHNRNLWLVVGMSAFGIPLGAAFGASMGNMGYIGIGLPIGMVIGMAVGTNMDKKAKEEGRQLDLEIKL